ncbi:hypothetical protein [Pantoea sp. Ep11b]|uniref:hypothetical protein n=1 Tax=unclassified Pantoea TaxID=2630326 RepID=UPI00346090F6
MKKPRSNKRVAFFLSVKAAIVAVATGLKKELRARAICLFFPLQSRAASLCCPLAMK